MTHLKSDDNSVQVQNGLPVLPQNVQAHIALEIDVGMVDFV